MLGSIIRMIRVSKSIKAKDLYNGIITKAHYIRFEKDLVELGTSKLLKILDRLNVSVSEAMFIGNKFDLTPSQQIWSSFATYANSRNAIELERLYTDNKSNTNKRDRVIANLAKITSEHIQSLQITNDSSNIIIEYLTEMNVWTLDELSIFTASYYLFNPMAQENLMNQAFKMTNRYLHWHNYKERISNLLTNYVYHCYFTKRILDGDRWLNKLNDINIDTLTLYQGYYRELCREISNQVHNGHSDRTKIALLDSQLNYFIGSSTLLLAYDDFCRKYKSN